MIESIGIKQFKNLSSCRINNLARVNLFVGKNNVGKSSLLEAISLLLANGSVNWIKELLKNRGMATVFDRSDKEACALSLQNNIASLYTGRNIDNFGRCPIVISAKDSKAGNRIVTLQLGYLSYETITNTSGEKESRWQFYRPDLIDTSNPGNLTPAITIEINDKDWRFYNLSDLVYPQRDKLSHNFEFVRSSSTSTPDNASLFDRIAMTDLQQWLVKALNIIDPRIRNINFLNDPLSRCDTIPSRNRVPIVVLQNDDTRYPLRSMGDGVNRLLTIILSMLNCKNGSLLVDEVENGLHYTSLRQLWKIIFQLATELDIQVFATTHSNDCIRSFIEADQASEGAIIRLEALGDGTVEGVQYTDPEELDYINNNNVEIR